MHTPESGPSVGADAVVQTVLLVEDDQGLRESLATVLGYQEGVSILQAASAEEAGPLLVAHDPDLVVLDVNLPGEDGLGLLRRLRADGDARQVLLLTARQEVADRVVGLDAGADDYLPKPFALDELLARVRALLRRAATIGAAASSGSAASAGAMVDRFTVGSVTVEPSARRVTVVDEETVLTKLEYDLLELLMRHADQVLPRAVIHERIWGYDEDYASNTLEVLVSSLRRKLEAGGAKRVVHTVRGVGYVARP
ncbi:MAG: response regulator transcription factor [Actinomycetota bacterium]